jgi:hypothetical protein
MAEVCACEFEPGATAAAVTERSGAGFYAALVLIAVIIGALLETVGPHWVRTIFANVTIDSAATVAAALAALAAAVSIHEAGHLIMALACDFEILGGRLGPLRIQQLHGKRKLSFSLSRLFSCSISAAPRTCERWRTRMLLVVVAGPLAT